MKFTHTDISGLAIIEPKIISDDRGKFFRFFCHKVLSENGIEFNPVQINCSVNNNEGTLRGLHYQNPPHAEAKIVGCTKGSLLDVAIDIRKDSDTFLRAFSIELNAENRKMLYIPKGFAHGFQTLEDNTEILYLHDEYYTPTSEHGLNALDPLFKIKWPREITTHSDRDRSFKKLDEKFKGMSL